MAAPKKNQFWKLRSKHGREKLFQTPDLLWEAACEYFEWCDKNPWKKCEAIKSGDFAGKIVKVPTQRPFTLTGLLLYIGANEAYWRQFKAAEHEDFSTVISAIESVIETQQLEGAAVGAFNANIISRKLGLTDKKDVTSNGEQIGMKIEVLSADMINELNKLKE